MRDYLNNSGCFDLTAYIATTRVNREIQHKTREYRPERVHLPGLWIALGEMYEFNHCVREMGLTVLWQNK